MSITLCCSSVVRSNRSAWELTSLNRSAAGGVGKVLSEDAGCVSDTEGMTSSTAVSVGGSSGDGATEVTVTDELDG